MHHKDIHNHIAAVIAERCPKASYVTDSIGRMSTLVKVDLPYRVHLEVVIEHPEDFGYHLGIALKEVGSRASGKGYV